MSRPSLQLGQIIGVDGSVMGLRQLVQLFFAWVVVIVVAVAVFGFSGTEVRSDVRREESRNSKCGCEEGLGVMDPCK